MSRPHILLIGGDGRPSGVPRHMTDLARALSQEARVSVASEVDQGGFSGLEALGARHIPLSGLASRLNPMALRTGWRELVQVLQREKADLVWFHARLPVLLGRLALVRGAWDRSGAHVALTYHGLPFGAGHRPLSSGLSRGIETYLLQRCPSLDLVCLTRTQATKLRTTLPASARHRIHVLGNASSLGALPVPDARAPGRHLVMTGRSGWQKNYDRALRLMRHLPEDIRLSLCGQGTETPAFAARIARLAGPAAPRVRALGPLADVRPLLASADGYMLTSRYEGLPIGALEAMEAGLPLILAPFEGAESLLQDHPAGLALPQEDTEAAARIDALLTQFIAGRDSLHRAIRAHWTARFSPDSFDAAARTLVRNWLG